MSKYKHVVVNLSHTVDHHTQFEMRVESSMHVLTLVMDQIDDWRRRNPGCTVYPDSLASHGMSFLVFARPSEVVFSVYVAELEPIYLKDELKRMKPSNRSTARKVVVDAFRAFEADLAAVAVTEAA